jgi:hypothetical protein
MTTGDQAPRTTDNGNGWTSLKAWSSAIGLVGIPGTIALFLVYDGATRRAELERQFQAIQIKQDQTLENQRLLAEQMQTQIRVTVRACSNAAKDDAARARCFDP